MVEVPTKEEFDQLKQRVDSMDVPQDVKDALLVVLNWLVGELT